MQCTLAVVCLLALLNQAIPDASPTERFRDLGVQITSSTIQGSTFAKDPQGRDIVCTVVRGEPAKLVIYEIRGGEMLGSFELPGAKGAWNATTATDGSVYVGTDNNGHLYRWIPGEQRVHDLGQVLPEQTFVWDVEPGRDGEVFCGTYPGGNVVRYHPDDGFTDVGRGAVAEGEQYVRCLAYDPETDKVYAGVGSHAHLIELNPRTGEKTDILPEKYSNKKFVYALNLQAGRLFAKLTDGPETLVINARTREVESVFDDVTAAQLISAPSPDDGRVYHTIGGRLYSYDVETRQHERLDVRFGMDALALKWIDFDEAEVPGAALVGLARQRRVFGFHPKTGQVSAVNLNPLPVEPTPIQSIFAGPDGRIWSGGYLSGGVTTYDPAANRSEQIGTLSQPEDITSIDSTIYFGLYPRARLVSYDVKRHWNWQAQNPRQFATLDEHEQDRPFAMLGVRAFGRSGTLFIGTVPDYGMLGGALSVYDVESGRLDTYRDIVPDQSVVSLTYSAMKVFGGTSISGGLGVAPKASEAKLFVFDPALNQKIFETAPVPGARAITALVEGPDGNIWGFADGTLFIIHPQSFRLIESKELFPLDPDRSGHVWRQAKLVVHPNRDLYGTFAGKLFRLDRRTRELTILRENGAALIAIDRDGRIYFTERTNLWQYTP